MSIWLVTLTFFIAYCIPAVTSDVQYVLSVSLTVSGMTANYNFNDDRFDRFFYCLRNKHYVICDAATPNSGDVVQTRSCLQGDNSDFDNSDGFTCKATVGGIACKRGDSAPEDTGCLRTFNVEHNVLLSQQAQMTWAGVENVRMSSNRAGIMIKNLPNNTFVIQETNNPTLSTVMTKLQTDAQTDSSITMPTATGGLNADKGNKGDDGEDNNMPIIIGAAVGGIVVVSVIVIIVIVLWRRKKRPSSSSAANNKTYEDTDIYPYGDCNLNNTQPNHNPSNLNTNSTPITYSTVDPDKKLNKTQISSDTNNANKLKPKKPRFNQNLDYTEVDIDNDASNDQRSSNVQSGQSVANRIMISASAPPNPSVKPGYYNISSETGEDLSERYSHVVKTNKNKDASAINENVTGSNPARDPSGYEEAVPRTDTQYTTVDPSDNNTTIPAPDGVYAKLHDPLRNITDVYNEWPATDNAGK